MTEIFITTMFFLLVLSMLGAFSLGMHAAHRKIELLLSMQKADSIEEAIAWAQALESGPSKQVPPEFSMGIRNPEERQPVGYTSETGETFVVASSSNPFALEELPEKHKVYPDV